MNNKNTKLQFTELTPDDIALHEYLYISLLVCPEKIGANYSTYYNYAIKELQKANALFQKTFG